MAGRPVERDRDSEFTATGPVAELVTRARRVRAQLADDVAAAEPSAPLRTANGSVSIETSADTG